MLSKNLNLNLCCTSLTTAKQKQYLTEILPFFSKINVCDIIMFRYSNVITTYMYVLLFCLFDLSLYFQYSVSFSLIYLHSIRVIIYLSNQQFSLLIICQDLVKEECLPEIKARIECADTNIKAFN